MPSRTRYRVALLALAVLAAAPANALALSCVPPVKQAPLDEYRYHLLKVPPDKAFPRAFVTGVVVRESRNEHADEAEVAEVAVPPREHTYVVEVEAVLRHDSPRPPHRLLEISVDPWWGQRLEPGTRYALMLGASEHEGTDWQAMLCVPQVPVTRRQARALIAAAPDAIVYPSPGGRDGDGEATPPPPTRLENAILGLLALVLNALTLR